MNKRLLIGICLAVSLLIAIPFLWFAWKAVGMGLLMNESARQARAFTQELQKPEVFTPAALTIARMCQAGVTNEFERFTNLVPHSHGGLGDCWGSTSSNSASREFGGGFWHFGYQLELDKTSPDKLTNSWILTMYIEGEPNRTLLKFSLPASETNFHSLSN